MPLDGIRCEGSNLPQLVLAIREQDQPLGAPKLSAGFDGEEVCSYVDGFAVGGLVRCVSPTSAVFRCESVESEFGTGTRGVASLQVGAGNC